MSVIRTRKLGFQNDQELEMGASVELFNAWFCIWQTEGIKCTF